MKKIKKTRPLLANIKFNIYSLSKNKLYSRINLIARKTFNHFKIYILNKKAILI